MAENAPLDLHYYGRPVAEMDRDELLELVRFLYGEVERERAERFAAYRSHAETMRVAVEGARAVEAARIVLRRMGSDA